MSMKDLGFKSLGVPRRAICLKSRKIITVAQLFYDSPRQMFIDFAVAWNGLAHFRTRVLIPIMFAAMPNENATQACQLLNQFDAFHDTCN
jgi:hypothetical protein